MIWGSCAGSEANRLRSRSWLQVPAIRGRDPNIIILQIIAIAGDMQCTNQDLVSAWRDSRAVQKFGRKPRVEEVPSLMKVMNQLLD